MLLILPPTPSPSSRYPNTDSHPPSLSLRFGTLVYYFFFFILFASAGSLAALRASLFKLVTIPLMCYAFVPYVPRVKQIIIIASAVFRCFQIHVYARCTCSPAPAVRGCRVRIWEIAGSEIRGCDPTRRRRVFGEGPRAAASRARPG